MQNKQICLQKRAELRLAAGNSRSYVFWIKTCRKKVWFNISKNKIELFNQWESGRQMNQYLLLVLVHLKEEYEARKKKEDLGWFLIYIYQNTAEERAQILLHSNALWKTAEAVGERKRKPTRAEK